MEGQTQETDVLLDNLFEEEQGTGNTDVEAAKSDDVKSLTLDELNEKAGRKGDNAFTSKEDFFKHYENLKSFVGKKQEPVKPVEDTSTKEELAQLKKELAKKDFVMSQPTAKEALAALEAYAEKTGKTLDEAWNSDEFKPIAQALATKGETGKTVITNNRINPVQSQQISELAKEARTGNQAAGQKLVEEVLGEALGMRK